MNASASTDLFSKRLDVACTAMQVDITYGQKQNLLEYLVQLDKWNKTYNLTAIRDPEQALTHHIFDSLSVISPLQKYFHGKKIPYPKILDVGSGGGLPGVVIAIAMPQTTVLCVDTVEKKVSFIRHAAGVLKLANLKGHHARIEQMEQSPSDIVISRAFSSLKDFAELAGKHVKEDGYLIAMKGKIPELEIKDMHSQERWKVSEPKKLDVPDLNAERCLVWMNAKDTK